ncbi:mitochondrial carrier protein-like protein [Myriangium duriaei CBS 260.36]|uniref:Mitochondrial carrier protein-like protein n=1 Tax=Myriangium duriaei CBS 260.36 TaxID=1168546 RepID=A0A9P4IXH7_9PEZI|nr:mitochondrial carrier protein-like protein [Myriangium duriaei CBS 260.36]
MTSSFPAIPPLPDGDFFGTGPNDPGSTQKDKKSNATTGASAAGVRALTARLAAFYFRVPVKAFFRTRVDYLAYPRAINPLFQAAPQQWSWRLTTPAILAHAVKTYGWSFIPNQVLPPLLANVTIGAVLYTAYLQSLSIYHDHGASQAKRIYPPPAFHSTFAAGFTAGVVQSVFAAPLDALTIRFQTNDLLEKRYKTMWHYALAKLKNIGGRGAYAGVSLSMVKDSFGAGLFFSSFEWIKSQGFYSYVRWHYKLNRLSGDQKAELENQRIADIGSRPVIRPHYMMEPTFLLLAGAGATVLQQSIQHPMLQIQEIHYRRLEGLDRQMVSKPSRVQTLELYGQSYRKTLKQCMVYARKAGGWRTWLFADFWRSTLRQVPSTSAGLIVFEIVRRKYGLGSEAVRIQMDDYDILLP